jgi:Mitochondrial carrier protein
MNNLVTRKQTSGQTSKDGKPASSASIIRDIYREKGITGTLPLLRFPRKSQVLTLGFWSGYRSSILLTLNPSITYYIFELFKSRFPPGSLQRGTKGKAHTSLETFLFAAVAKSIASTITYPFILAKARMQVSERRNLTPISVVRRIVREEGWQALFEGLPGQIFKGFWSQGLLLMFKDRVGAVIIALYIRLYQYRQRGGDLNSLLEEGAQGGVQYAQRVGLPVNMSDAKGLLKSAADTAQRVIQNPTQAAEEVVDKVSDEVVKVAKTARGALRGTNAENVRQVVNEAVESAKGEVKGSFEQIKKK